MNILMKLLYPLPTVGISQKYLYAPTITIPAVQFSVKAIHQPIFLLSGTNLFTYSHPIIHLPRHISFPLPLPYFFPPSSPFPPAPYFFFLHLLFRLFISLFSSAFLSTFSSPFLPSPLLFPPPPPPGGSVPSPISLSSYILTYLFSLHPFLPSIPYLNQSIYLQPILQPLPSPFFLFSLSPPRLPLSFPPIYAIPLTDFYN